MEDEVAIRQSGTNSMTSALLGRAMNSLLTSKPKKLEDAIARLGDAPASTSLVTVEDSLWFLSKYVRDAAERVEALDEVLIPMIENVGLSLRLKESKNINQTEKGFRLEACAHPFFDELREPNDRLPNGRLYLLFSISSRKNCTEGEL